MCGFVGYVAEDEGFQLDLETWSDSIRHRGPDQGGHAEHGRYGVGTRRLSILDLSDAGSQPMQGDRYILGFNGEIYNHHDIRAELRSAGTVSFRSQSDTETVLLAIERWGVLDTLARLNGMYALSVWDTHRQEMTLARDPLGIKPVFYIQTTDAILFASEVKALRPYANGTLSRDAMALYFYFGFIPAPHSLLDGVCKLRAGEAITFSRGGITRNRIIPTEWSNPVPLARGQQERVCQLRSEVEAAVERQLLSDVPVGVFLSGGVDSTIIASVAAAKTQITSFSLRPGAAALDPAARRDADLAAQCAERLGLTHHEVDFSPDDLVHELERFLLQIDEPVAELYAAAELLLSRKARAEGVKVVLTGHGADELFMGYPTYDAVFRGDLNNTIPLLGPALKLASHAPVLSGNRRRNLAGAASVWRRPVQDSYAIVSGVHFDLNEAASFAGIPVDRVRALVNSVLEETSETVRRLPRGADVRNAERFARMDLMLMVPDHYNTRLDRTTMGASVEARVPLQDLRLVGLVAQLSHNDLMRGGLKGMLKDAFSDVLPEEITNQKKQTFQAPMLSWISGAFAPWITEQLATAPFSTSQARDAHVSGPESTRHAYRLWSLALLEGWRNALALEY